MVRGVLGLLGSRTCSVFQSVHWSFKCPQFVRFYQVVLYDLGLLCVNVILKALKR